MPALTDFGKKIGGARKDFFVKGWSAANFDALTAEDRDKAARRDRLWPSPDYKKMIAEGVPKEVVFRIKLLRERIPTRIVRRGQLWKWKLDFDFPARQRAYVEAVLKIREAAAAVRNSKDFACVRRVYRSLSLESRWALDMVVVGDNPFNFRAFVSPDEEWHLDVQLFGEAVDDGWPECGPAIRKKSGDTERPRVVNPLRVGGPEPRDKKPATAELFVSLFQVRGGEFGKNLSFKNRQTAMDRTCDALADLADILSVPPASIGLGGTLALAFGARGKGGVRRVAAHYERERRVINLTGSRGAGALCHEWWHAFDHHLATLAGFPDDLASAVEDSDPKISAIREAMAQLLYDFDDKGKPSPFLAKAQSLDKGKRKPYYSLPEELSARAFEAGVAAFLKLGGRQNDFLVFGVDRLPFYPERSRALDFFGAVAPIIRKTLSAAAPETTSEP